MNYWQPEITAEHYRQRISNEVKQIRLEKLALKAQPTRPSLLKRTIFNFANWMISTGKQLHRQYEIPSVNCNQARQHYQQPSG